jgi:poly(3-hydroxybutyrate) depolymerase
MHLYTSLILFAHSALSSPLSNNHASKGCHAHNSPTPTLGTSFNVSLTSDNQPRTFLLHLPESYTPQTPAPIYLSFHGRSRTATYQESLSQLSNPAYNPSALAVYPQGVNNSWQGPDYAVAGVDDLLFVADLLDYLEAAYCVDTSRIYATGKSNGAGFVGTLACSSTPGARIAAFAPVSGAFYDFRGGNGCQPSRKGLPVMEFHGDNDTTIPYEGGAGSGGDLPDVGNWLAWWGDWNGCRKPASVSEEYGGGVTVSSWDCGKGKKGLVKGYKVHGLGHDWPSLTPNLDNSEGSVVEATRVIVDWFARWRL